MARLPAGGLAGSDGREGTVLLLDGLGEGIVLILQMVLVGVATTSSVAMVMMLARMHRRLLLDLGHLLVLEGPHLVLEPHLGPHVALHHVVLLEDGRGAGLDGLLAVVVGAKGLVMMVVMMRRVVMVSMLLLLRSFQVGRMGGGSCDVSCGGGAT